METKVHGLIHDMEAAARDGEGADCLIGVPSQMYALAAHAPGLRPKTVLLSADYVPVSVQRFLEKTWNCRVFTHWGMTEIFDCVKALKGIEVSAPVHIGDVILKNVADTGSGPFD